jgi:hypothetical protein
MPVRVAVYIGTRLLPPPEQIPTYVKKREGRGMDGWMDGCRVVSVCVCVYRLLLFSIDSFMLARLRALDVPPLCSCVYLRYQLLSSSSSFLFILFYIE